MKVTLGSGIAKLSVRSAKNIMSFTVKTTTYTYVVLTILFYFR